MNDVVGFCHIKKDAKTGKGSEIESFLGKDVRVLEFQRDGDGVLVVNDQANAIAMFDIEDVPYKFECSVVDNLYIVPPNLSLIEQTMYASKLQSRKGGYNNILMQMVIKSSLHRGEYTDGFLFSKQ